MLLGFVIGAVVVLGLFGIVAVLYLRKMPNGPWR